MSPGRLRRLSPRRLRLRAVRAAALDLSEVATRYDLGELGELDVRRARQRLLAALDALVAAPAEAA